MRVIEGSLHEELKQLVLSKAPQEAVGLLTKDDRIIPLTNQSSEPENNFEILRSELIEALGNETSLVDLTLWHSHPNGGVGPSRTDMKQRIPHLTHLVVTIIDGDVVYTYY